MIEREFLFWVIVGTSLISYSIGYFLWLFVHWYYDERPEKRHAELRTQAINEYNERHKEEVYKPTYTIKWDDNALTKILTENRERVDKIVAEHSKRVSEFVERVISSPPVKTSGEPEKEKSDPYWAVVSPEGKTVCIKSAKIPYEVYKYYAEKIAKVSTLMLDARGYKVEPYKPTSPPPPPSLASLVSRLGTCPKCKRKAVLMMSQDCCYRCY